MWEVVILEIHRKLTCGSSFCIVGSCKIQIAMENWATTGSFNENNLGKVSFLKLQTKENLLGCFH